MATEDSATDIYDEFVPFYDLSYANRQAEVAFYTSVLRTGDRSVLELGCGTGAIVGPLGQELSVRHGMSSRAVGVDRSLEMLRWAQRRYPTVEWIHGDMTAPRVQGPFDLIICAFNTLQMLESEAAVMRTFEAARDLLSQNGLFVFDVYNSSYVEATPVPAAPRIDRVVRTFTDVRGHVFEVREDAIEAADGASVQLDWRVMDTSVIPPAQRARLVVQLRHYSPAAVSNLVSAAGLRIVDRYGDVWKSPFDERASKKQVLVCTR